MDVITVEGSTPSLHPLALLRDLLSADQWRHWIHEDQLSAVMAVVALLTWVFLVRFAIALGLALLAAPARGTASGRRLATTAARVAPKWVRPLVVGLVAAPILGASVAASAQPIHGTLPSLDRGGVAISQPAHPSRDTDRAPIVEPAPPTASPASTTASEAPTDGAHTVVSGECLWRIAGDELGPNATDAQIAARWPQWYAANRDVVGDDPNLIYPGQQLTPPSHHEGGIA